MTPAQYQENLLTFRAKQRFLTITSLQKEFKSRPFNTPSQVKSHQIKTAQSLDGRLVPPSTCVGGAHARARHLHTLGAIISSGGGVKIMINRGERNSPRLGDKGRPRVSDPAVDALPSAGSRAHKRLARQSRQIGPHAHGSIPRDRRGVRKVSSSRPSPSRHVNSSVDARVHLFVASAPNSSARVFPLKPREIGSRGLSGGVSDAARVPYPGRSGRSELRAVNPAGRSAIEQLMRGPCGS